MCNEDTSREMHIAKEWNTVEENIVPQVCSA